MKFCLMINPSKQWRASIQHALDLVKTMTTAGHTVNTVFFYGQAIKIIEYPTQLKLWQQWGCETNTPLLLCSALLENHNLLTLSQQTKGFEAVSMGRWVQAVEQADKTVELC